MLAELLALVLLASPLPRPDVQEFAIGETQVVVRVDSPWPKALNKGWLPIFVQVDNGDDRAHTVKLRGECWGVTRVISAELDVGPGQSSSIELLVPAFANVSNNVRLSAEVAGSRTFCPTGLGADEVAVPAVHSVLVLGSELPAAGTSERWTEEVSTGIAQVVPDYGGSVGMHVMVRRMGVHVPTPSTTPNNIRIQAARFDQMASRSEAYSSLDVVVLDVSNGLPEAQRLAPLISWANLGGSLLVVGPRAEELARGIPELERWMEPRFGIRETFPYAENGNEAVHIGWRIGLGSLCVDERTALEDPKQRELLRMLAIDTPGILEARAIHTPPVIPDLFSLPLKAFALFLVFFAALIGPVNFLLVKRAKRPAMLLITIPLIAFAAAVLLFGFGVAAQGLGVKIATETLAVLDQREHRSSSAELRMIFAGLSPGPGLVLRSGTSCYPISTYEADGQFSPVSESERTFLIGQTDGFQLSGEFLPARRAFVQQVLSEHAERARLGIKKEGAKLQVENGLGTTIQTLVLRDAAGEFHRLSAALASGASAELVPITAEAAAESSRELGSKFLVRPGSSILPPACYLASLEHNPFGDDCGVSGDEVLGTHCVMGVLALDSEEWR